MHLATLRCSSAALLGALSALQQRSGWRLTLRNGRRWLRRSSLAHERCGTKRTEERTDFAANIKSRFPRYKL